MQVSNLKLKKVGNFMSTVFRAKNSSVSFDKVLLTDNDGQVKVGAPVVKGAAVKCKILKHLKDDKVLVFKKKRRTGYQKCNGHRQYLTQILVEEIVA